MSTRTSAASLKSAHASTRRPGTLLLRVGPLSLRTTRRRVLVALVLFLALAGLALVSLMTGTIRLSVPEALQALAGEGSARTERIVWTIRVPRLLAALAVGSCLALSGAVFQNLTGNPLGSPDVIGFVTGAATGAIIAIIWFAAGAAVVALAAVGSGLATAVAVVALSSVRGRSAAVGTGGGYRLVLVGIGAGALLGALNDLLLTRVTGEVSIAAQRWLVGSLNSRDWDVVLPCLVIAVIGVPATVALGRRMAALQLGDVAAAQAGVPVVATRLALTATGVVLVAVATATTGPIAFVALAAPQIAWRLAGRGRPALVCTALLGAVLLLGADVLSQHLPTSVHLPVGLVTGLLGGVYLLILLTKGKK